MLARSTVLDRRPGCQRRFHRGPRASRIPLREIDTASSADTTMRHHRHRRHADHAPHRRALAAIKRARRPERQSHPPTAPLSAARARPARALREYGPPSASPPRRRGTGRSMCALGDGAPGIQSRHERTSTASNRPGPVLAPHRQRDRRGERHVPGEECSAPSTAHPPPEPSTIVPPPPAGKRSAAPEIRPPCPARWSPSW